MTQPEPLSVDDALERLVNQFSDPMAFFRELIQNALDAGSEEVEVWFEYDARERLMVIHVDDWGAGMNRDIIETRLTRLFSSSKDGDLTKIGKFGIGFVSVFAIAPQAVSIDTSREGEHWRILFDEQRRFSLIKREEPTEGTKIEIYKEVDRREYARFVARAREVITFWCKHVHKEIRVDGQQINAPFDLDAPCKIRDERDGEIIVVGHPADAQAFAGFYNRGLTLAEEAVLPGIAFKASSAKLEHTLTRDGVVREAGFGALMKQVEALVAGPLRAALCEQLGAAVRALEVDAAKGANTDALAQLEYLWGAARYHVEAGHELADRPDTPLFRSPGGAQLSLAALRKPKQRKVLLSHTNSELCALFERQGHSVVWLPHDCVRGRALLEQLAPAVESVSSWCTALPPRDAGEAQRWQILASAVAHLLDAWGAKLGGVKLGHLDYADSSVADRVAITLAQEGEATLVSEAGELGTGLFSTRRIVLLNADHPTIRAAGALAQTEPELAAYFAVKAFLLGGRLDAAVDEALAGLTDARRAKRMEVLR